MSVLILLLVFSAQVFSSDPTSSDFDLVQLSLALGPDPSSTASTSSGRSSGRGVSVHPACLRAASGLGGGGCCDHSAEQVLEEVRRCQGRACSFCSRPGATVDCSDHSCSAGVHLPCLYLHGKLGRRRKSGVLPFCKQHAASLRKARANGQQVKKKTSPAPSLPLRRPSTTPSSTSVSQRQRVNKLKGKLSKKAVIVKCSSSSVSLRHVKLKRSPERSPPAPPPLLRLVSRPTSSSALRCQALSCRCPFGDAFSDETFWPLTHCHACSKATAHRFCVRREGAKKRRQGGWTCSGCLPQSMPTTEMSPRRKGASKQGGKTSPKASPAAAPAAAPAPKPKKAKEVRLKKYKKLKLSSNGEHPPPPPPPRSSKVMLTSMKMSFCRELNLQQVASHKEGPSSAASPSASPAKKRADRSPLSLRQREPSTSPPKCPLSKQSPSPNKKSATGGRTPGKENQKKSAKKKSEMSPAAARAPSASASPQKDGAWIVKKDLFSAKSPSPTTEASNSSTSSPQHVSGEKVQPPPPGSSPGDKGKPLPKGWVWIVENPFAQAALPPPPQQDAESSSSESPTRKKTRSCNVTPMPSPPNSAPTSPGKLQQQKEDQSVFRLPTTPPSKKKQSKSSSGTSSPAKKFVDNTTAVDHGALVRRLDEAFASEEEEKKGPAKTSQPKPPSAAISKQKKKGGEPRNEVLNGVKKMFHGKKEHRPPAQKVSVKGITPIDERLLYHVRTNLPIDQGEVEAEEDYEWLVGNSDRMIDDFLDLNEGEKAFFKLWNAHLHRYPCYGDRMMLKVLHLFVEEQGEQVALGRLYRNFVLHVTNLHDFGVFGEEILEHFCSLMRLRCREVLVEGKRGVRRIEEKDLCGDASDNNTKCDNGGTAITSEDRTTIDLKKKSVTASDSTKFSAVSNGEFPPPQKRQRSIRKRDAKKISSGPRTIVTRSSPRTDVASEKAEESVKLPAPPPPPAAPAPAATARAIETIPASASEMTPPPSSFPQAPSVSRQSSEHSLNLYLSESDAEGERVEAKVEENADKKEELQQPEKTPTLKKRGRPRKKKRPSSEIPKEESSHDDLRAAGETNSNSCCSSSNAAAVSYASDKGVDKISDNIAVEAGICFTGTRRGAFSPNVARYSPRGRRGRRRRHSAVAAAGGVAAAGARGRGRQRRASVGALFDAEEAGKVPAEGEAQKKPQPGRRGRPPRQRVEAEVALEGGCQQAMVGNVQTTTSTGGRGRKRKAAEEQGTHTTAQPSSSSSSPVKLPPPPHKMPRRQLRKSGNSSSPSSSLVFP